MGSARRVVAALSSRASSLPRLASTLFDTDSDRAFEIANSMPPGDTVVIYCVGGECDASHNVARRLAQIGFTDLRIMGVGYTDWVNAGFPIEEGSAP
jgi:rhodanese-related sulfurtransferase